ncbi:hypothetical protein [Prosthecodimorpha hirschii]|uniref:hypothetical protein n=1 Tax=Prosthecodimorpha hirschii TaxID=665126 RepID=UPI001129E24A|nr:hypothetical protein [Prosthecomicrobium hirschii]
MFGWLFGRRKQEKFFLEMMKAAAEGEGRRKLFEAASMLGIIIKGAGTDEEKCAQIASGLVNNLLKASGTNINSNEDDQFVAALFSVIACSHFSRILTSQFELSAMLSWVILTAGDIEKIEISNQATEYYIDMTERKAPVLIAAGNSIAKWVNQPTAENFRAVVNVFDHCRSMVGYA